MARWIGFFIGATIASGVIIGKGFSDADRLHTPVKPVKVPDLSPDETKTTTTDSALISNKQQTLLPTTVSNSPVPEVISNVNTALSDVSHQQLPEEIDDQKVNPTEPVSVIRNWYPVWQPFRSELSAIGFADHLTRLTQHEYRVHRMSAWTYQVEFAYSTETELTVTLQNIEAKAGVVLKLSP